MAILAFALAATATGRAQAEKSKDKAAAETPPVPQHIFLPTADGWRIHGMYYPPQPGIRRGQEVVPILAVHGWGGQAMEYRTLALSLQRRGHAVLALDLRGHGGSRRWRGPDGEFQTVDYEALDPTQDFNTIQDLEAAKRFLVQRNNAGELNIDRLVVVATEEGCLAALNWTAQDWSWPPTTAGKQGQDVKALVLLSPVLTQGRVTARASEETGFVPVRRGYGVAGCALARPPAVPCPARGPVRRSAAGVPRVRVALGGTHQPTRRVGRRRPSLPRVGVRVSACHSRRHRPDTWAASRQRPGDAVHKQVKNFPPLAKILSCVEVTVRLDIGRGSRSNSRNA